jgi:NADH-quinone oxidoreductase subunit N
MIEALPGASSHWHPVVWWLAAVTMVVGNVLALSQRNLVRLLAYSSIAHAGYLLVAIVVNSSAGVSALVFYAVSYTLSTMGAFAVLITINDGRDKAPMLEDLNGLWQVRPALCVAMAVYFLAFLGMPLVGGMGFFAKWYLLQAALQGHAPQTALAVVLVLSSVISAAYYLTVISAMFMRPRTEGAAVPSSNTLTQALIGFTIVALLVLGVYPTPVSRLARRALPHSLVGPAPVPAVARPLPFKTASVTR